MSAVHVPATGGEHRSGFVALCGRPNVGKSTLLNQLLGSKVAIVSDKPQTTRNRILGILNRPDAQVVLVDTPGVHKPQYRMNVRMMRATLDALQEVDVVAALTDVTQPFGRGDGFLVDLLAERTTPTLLLINKIDRIRKEQVLPVIELWSNKFPFAEIIPVSALTGDGLDAFQDAVVKYLPKGPNLFPEDQLSDVTDRFLAAEIVREKILHHTREELPYTTTVIIDDYDDDDGAAPLARIAATILVERDSQKGIIIGRKGAALKRIGTEARVELEQLLEKRVYLQLQVKVGGDWRADDRLLDRLGLSR